MFLARWARRAYVFSCWVQDPEHIDPTQEACAMDHRCGHGKIQAELLVKTAHLQLPIRETVIYLADIDLALCCAATRRPAIPFVNPPVL